MLRTQRVNVTTVPRSEGEFILHGTLPIEIS
jgi:hypothetical protein